MTKIAVYALTHLEEKEAAKLSSTLMLPFVDKPSKKYDYFLVVTPDFIGIEAAHQTKFAPFFIDFNSSKMRYRLQKISRKNEILARALGPPCKVVDGTAGFGKDSFILAALGFEVLMVERSTIVHALLADALNRAAKIAELKPIVDRLTLICTSALNYLKEHTQEMDIIYLDPMFPDRDKTAHVKKDMQLLQGLLGKEEDGPELLSVALTCAKHRVVVKRPRKGPALISEKPNFTLVGKSSRFDVYTSKKP